MHEERGRRQPIIVFGEAAGMVVPGRQTGDKFRKTSNMGLKHGLQTWVFPHPHYRRNNGALQKIAEVATNMHGCNLNTQIAPPSAEFFANDGSGAGAVTGCLCGF